MTTKGLSKVRWDVSARPMDDKRVEENSVTLLHVKMHPRVVLCPPDPVVHLVNTLLPLRIVMLLKITFVSSGLNHEAAITIIDMFHSSPGSHDTVSRAEGKVVKVLVERMAGGSVA